MRSVLAIVALLSGCGFGHAPLDAESVDAGATDAPEVDATKKPVKGCAWFDGAWVLTDCTGEAFLLQALTGTDCITHITAPNPTFAGAWGQVKDGAITLTIALGTQCQGSFDGESIRGACTVPGGPCAFEAVPKAK